MPGRRSLIIDPSTVGTLIGWYSARKVAAIPNPTGGLSRITRCYDLSGGGKDATLAGTYQPLWTPADPKLNGRPSIGNDQTAAAVGGGLTALLVTSAPVTIYWAGYVTIGTNQVSPDVVSTSGGSGRMFTNATSAQLRVNGSGNVITAAGAFSVACIVCMAMDLNAGTSSFYVNAAVGAAGTVVSTATVTGTSITLLNGQSTNNNGGYFGDTLFFSGLHNLSQRQKMIGWLGYDYRVPVTLN